MDVRNLQDKRITVVGAAKSGLAAASLLRDAGAAVFVTEKKDAAEDWPESLRRAGIGFETGGHSPRALEADMMIVSPGVPSQSDLVQSALERGIPVLAEIEAASWFCRAPIVAVTGSNGKTTTTTLTGYLFEKAGWKTVVAGNIGYAFSEAVRRSEDADVVVLEVSSFQLDHIDTFRPRVSVLLNVTPDHLDRYDHDFAKYAASKARIFENQREGDALVYNADDEIVADKVASMTSQKGVHRFGISRETEPSEGAFLRGNDLVLRIGQQEEVLMQAEMLALRGQHNLYNSLAAAMAARVMEVGSDVVRESLMTFEGVPHRLEFVRELDGVRYINDSKATNVNAVWYALESFQERIVLIAGGRDKGNDYAPLRPLVKAKVRGLIAMGESADKVIRELADLAPAHATAYSMEEAVLIARRLARPGDVVLLSPACASFDMFRNYEDRGDAFKRVLAAM